ncbi:hypothetical protein PG989_004612 [Apiospora arundinis]
MVEYLGLLSPVHESGRSVESGFEDNGDEWSWYGGGGDAGNAHESLDIAISAVTTGFKSKQGPGPNPENSRETISERGVGVRVVGSGHDSAREIR